MLLLPNVSIDWQNRSHKGPEQKAFHSTVCKPWGARGQMGCVPGLGFQNCPHTIYSHRMLTCVSFEILSLSSCPELQLLKHKLFLPGILLVMSPVTVVGHSFLPVHLLFLLHFTPPFFTCYRHHPLSFSWPSSLVRFSLPLCPLITNRRFFFFLGCVHPWL